MSVCLSVCLFVCSCEVTGECGLCIPSQWRCDGDVNCSDGGGETTNCGLCVCLYVLGVQGGALVEGALSHP